VKTRKQVRHSSSSLGLTFVFAEARSLKFLHFFKLSSTLQDDVVIPTIQLAQQNHRMEVGKSKESTHSMSLLVNERMNSDGKKTGKYLEVGKRCGEQSWLKAS
jgi:hypothetical protein